MHVSENQISCEFHISFKILGIGFSNLNVQLNGLPGLDKNSYGYHGDDGKIWAAGSIKTYGPQFNMRYLITEINFLGNLKNH